MDFFLGAQDPAVKYAAQIQAVANVLDWAPAEETLRKNKWWLKEYEELFQ